MSAGAEYFKSIATGSCFFGHKWSKWQQYDAPMILKSNPLLQFTELKQKRFCMRCNLMQIKDI